MFNDQPPSPIQTIGEKNWVEVWDFDAAIRVMYTTLFFNYFLFEQHI